MPPALPIDALFVARTCGPCGKPADRQTLDALLMEACRVFGTDETQIRSGSRTAVAVRARAWIASQALSRGVATLSEVARAVGRDRATVRYAMRQYASEGS